MKAAMRKKLIVPVIDMVVVLASCGVVMYSVFAKTAPVLQFENTETKVAASASGRAIA